MEFMWNEILLFCNVLNVHGSKLIGDFINKIPKSSYFLSL